MKYQKKDIQSILRYLVEAIKLIEQVCKKMQKEKTVEEIAESLEESEEMIERIYQVALKYHADVEEKEKIYEELGDKELR